MSYASELREELIATAPRRGCCQRAYWRGLCLNAAATKSGNILLTASSLTARHEIVRVYRSLYRREALAERSTLLLSGEALYRELSQTAPQLVCKTCWQNYLRGAFVVAGTATDPEKAYHVEFRVADEEARDTFLALLPKDKFSFKCRALCNGYGLYLKNGEQLEDLIGAMGGHDTYFRFMNTRITRDIRNDENRATNCVTKNISKVVGAAGRVTEAIAAIRTAARFEAMPEELRETAALREKYADVSLSELAAHHNPPLTKSGLNHRLQKILAFAKSIEDDEKK